MGKLREYLKQYPVLKKTVYFIRDTREKAKKQTRMFRAFCNPLKANRELYVRNHGVEPNLEEPSNFNEKTMWLLHNVYKDDPAVTRCADKIGMRGYLKELGLDGMLPKLYGVWDDPKKINWDELPDRFVLKCNHGCGCNIICTDKQNLDKKAAIRKLQKWMKINYAYYYGEINYKNIKPLAFCEEFLDDGENSQPIDYKVHCFNGEPKLIMVCTERATGVKFMFTDMEYNRFDWEQGFHSGGTLPPKPDTLELMTQTAKKLSKDFPFVRIDYYSVRGKIYVGEMTFSPLGCAIDYITDDGLQIMGDWLDISEYQKGT